MDHIRPDSAAARMFAAALRAETMTVLDIGCAGGIDPSWRAFGDHLRAYAFDPSLQEIERLRTEESNPNIHYIPGFVGVPRDHPAWTPDPEGWRFNPWGRLSAHRTQILQQQRRAAVTPSDEGIKGTDSSAAHEPMQDAIAVMDERDLLKRNLWQKTTLADAAKPIVLSEYLDAHCVVDVDFLKIDVDGDDFTILRSFAADLEIRKVLGAVLEVGFHGGVHEHEHTFHNMDRFMRRAGFCLLGLTVRNYSLAALPRPFLFEHPFGAQTTDGRPIVGDALYMRDFGHPYGERDISVWSDDKLVKLAALYALFGRLDHAAELLHLAKDRLEHLLDIPAALDLLTAESQDCEPELWGERRFSSYSEYIAAYEADDPAFYAGHRRKQPLPQPKIGCAAETSRLEADLLQALADLQAMRRSTSWRLTAPLRALAQRLKGG